MKLFKKRSLIIFIVSLLLMILGLTFSLFPFNKEKESADAAHCTFNASWKAYWLNPKLNLGVGQYKNSQGEKFDISLGYVYLSSYSYNSALRSLSYSNNYNHTSYKYSSSLSYSSVEDNAWFSSTWFSYSFNFSAKASDGFMALWASESSFSDSGTLNFWHGNRNNTATVNVLFMPKLYNITFDLNGGNIEGNTTALVNNIYFYDRYDVPSKIPKKTGYTFNSWKNIISLETMKEGSPLLFNDTSYTQFLATYDANNYKVTFDKQGGADGSDSVTVTYDKLCPSITIPKRTGYKFLGYYDSDGTQYYNADGTGAINYTTDGNKTLYAHWEKEKYNLIFDANGGECYLSNMCVTYEDAIEFPTAKKTGHVFSGWEFNGKIYKGLQTIDDLGSDGDNVVMKAKWVCETYNIKYYHDSSENLAGSITVTYGSQFELDTPTKIGHYFTNWRYRDSGSCVEHRGDLYKGTITIPDWGNNDCDVPLQALWEKEKYIINFYTAGGNDVGSMEVTFGESYILPTTSKTGYIFCGWTYDNEVYVDNYNANTDFGENGKEVTFVAVWKAITYKIRFNSNGGKGSMSDLDMTYDIEKPLTDNIFIKANNLFLGWAVTEYGDVIYYNKASVKNLTTTNNDIINLYAVWKETWGSRHITPEGKGTANEPYLIANKENLAWMSFYTESVGSLTGYFKQVANIDLAGEEWLPIGNATRAFNGRYDGNGFYISNIALNNIVGVNRQYLGLFGYISGKNAIVENVRIKDGNIGTSTGSSWHVGGIAGRLDNGVIRNCTNFTSVTAGNDRVGGIVGFTFNGKIESCYNYGNVSGNLWVGGIAGETRGSVIISNCYAKCTTTAKSNWENWGGCNGGIVGYSADGTLSINSCGFEGELKYSQEGSQTRQGAIVGYAGNVAPLINNCYAKANLTTINNYGLCTGESVVTSCVFEINGKKMCMGTNFSNWVVTSDGRAIPVGITWLSLGGGKVTDIKQITRLGYEQVF